MEDVLEKRSKKRKRHLSSDKAQVEFSPSDTKVSASTTTTHKKKQTAAQTVLSQLPALLTKVSSSPLGNPSSSQCFYKVETAMYVSIAPMYSLNPIHGVNVQHLDPLVMTYFPAVSGVVIACLDVKIDKVDGAKITGESPFAFVWITAEFLVWRPQRGDILVGQINLQSRSHIGLLVHDVFNASITRDRIPANWQFIETELDEDAAFDTMAEEDADVEGVIELDLKEEMNVKSSGYWIDENGGKVDGKLTLIVESLEISSRVFSINGSLLKLGAVKEDLTVLGLGK
ncbi:hypothetical protein V1512DRAFT_265221 [Lipomyces arxii]|uniref:uncharacterized protein n=1 Tax=Lipomyces arxii TaxID=56418 RepID=UPI0034CD2C62